MERAERSGTTGDVEFAPDPDRPIPGRAGECFVVMPFGRKPIPTAPDRQFDFDKVYRVIMRRAIEAAGMVPIRADESTASGVIHTDMFKALRDKRVVLAELSLHNPNVYYELGIRHVLSSTGTVLMCRTNQPLPFDIALSRVVLYEYDGVHLDWEEAERVIPILRQYLLEAQHGYQDSPVHALIHIPTDGRQHGSTLDAPGRRAGQQLHRYQQELGERWRADDRQLTELMSQHAGSVFGARAIGYYCLATEELPDDALEVADHLVDAAQYGMANELFARLEGHLDHRRQLMYAASYSEEHPNVGGADTALAMIERTIKEVKEGLADDQPARAAALAEGYRRRAGLKQWRWQLTQDPADLDDSIDSLDAALSQMLDARRSGAWGPAGLVAQLRVKLMLHLRIREGDPQRPDTERHGDEVLTMTTDPTIDDGKALSWLRWYRVIVLADQGQEGEVRERIFGALRLDAELDDLANWDVGRRQYFLLRRFIDQYSEWFRDPTTVGMVSQALQSRLDV